MTSRSKLGLRETTSALVGLLQLIDCTVVVLLLWALSRLHGVPWSDYYTLLAGGSFAVCLLIFRSFELYRSRRGQEYHQEFATIVKAWAVFVGFLLMLFFLSKTSERYSRAIVLNWFGITPFALFVVHVIGRKVLRIMRTRGMNLKRAVIVGAGDLGVRLAEHIRNTPWLGIRVVGFFDDRLESRERLKTDKPLLGPISEVCHYLTENSVDYLYIALPMRAEAKITSIVNECRTLGAQIYAVPDLYAFKLFNAELESLGDMLLLNFNPDPRLKRYFDITFSLFVLLATLPLTALIALLIKLNDGGPVFYGHRRITAAGKKFRCLKFRTMQVDADRKLADILASDPRAREEWEKTFKLKNDPRITWIGQFLRKTSLDELPQFINVLKGDMSVVGARPIVHQELCEYYKENGGLYCSMKPGITGPWQVSKRNDTEDYDERVQLDTWYVLNRNFWLDIKIICKTVVCMISGRGAY